MALTATGALYVGINSNPVQYCTLCACATVRRVYRDAIL